MVGKVCREHWAQTPTRVSLHWMAGFPEGGAGGDKVIPVSSFFRLTIACVRITIDTMKIADFEWDAFKNAQNTEKHGVSFYEAQYAFADPQRVIIEDLDHGGDEDRFFCFGKVKGGVMTVRFTDREGRIRIIGAGYWRKGKRIYEKENHIYG